MPRRFSCKAIASTSPANGFAEVQPHQVHRKMIAPLAVATMIHNIAA
jgi:hypothetical protein